MAIVGQFDGENTIAGWFDTPNEAWFDEDLTFDSRTLLVVGGEHFERHAIDVAEDGLASSHNVGDIEQRVTRHVRGPGR